MFSMKKYRAKIAQTRIKLFKVVYRVINTCITLWEVVLREITTCI